MTHGRRPPLERPLAVVEDPAAWYVVVEDDRDDWLVRYEKADDFPAETWATNMATTYNARWFGAPAGER